MRGPLHFTARTITEDTTLKSNGQEIAVPKDATIFTWHCVTHEEEAIWGPTAKQFVPERFLEDNMYGVEFMPFGYAQRNCIGKRFAEMEMAMAIIKLLQRFQISLPKEDSTTTFDVPCDYTFSRAMSRCNLVFTPYKASL